MVIGNSTRDAEVSFVGEKQTPLTKFSLAIGKDKEDKGIFVECAAWQRLAYCACDIKKGDIVMAIGKIEEREYNEKTYKTLRVEWVDFKGKTQHVPPSPQMADVTPSIFGQEESEDELPF